MTYITIFNLGLLQVAFLFVYSFHFSFFFFFTQLYLQHKDIPRLGSNQSCSFRPMSQPWQHQVWATSATYASVCGNAGSLTHWAKPRIEPKSSQRWHLVLNHLSHNGNSSSCLLVEGYITECARKFTLCPEPASVPDRQLTLHIYFVKQNWLHLFLNLFSIFCAHLSSVTSHSSCFS